MALRGYLDDPPCDASKRFWRWCAAHPALRELHVARHPYLVAAAGVLQEAPTALTWHNYISDFVEALFPARMGVSL